MNVLIIEDHPAIVEGYMSILQRSKYGQGITFEVVQNCSEGLAQIREPNVHYDAIILDLHIPGDEAQLLHDGSDLTYYIKKHKPLSKLIISTAHTDSLRLYPIYQSAAPDAIMVKCDITAAELEKALDDIYMESLIYRRWLRRTSETSALLQNTSIFTTVVLLSCWPKA